MSKIVKDLREVLFPIENVSVPTAPFKKEYFSFFLRKKIEEEGEDLEKEEKDFLVQELEKVQKNHFTLSPYHLKYYNSSFKKIETDEANQNLSNEEKLLEASLALADLYLYDLFLHL